MTSPGRFAPGGHTQEVSKMRPVSLFSLAGALGLIPLLSACGGASPASTALVPGSFSPVRATFRSRKHAGPLNACGSERRPRTKMALGESAKPAAGTPYLYVADDCGSVVDALHSSNYFEVGSITNGPNIPADVFLDSRRNLYVANYGNGTVTEYAPDNWSEPSFTYTANVVSPFVVTADANGNVYEGDLNGYINEFYQQRNGATIASCLPVSGSSPIFGIAVDSHNDVFAALLNANTNSYELVEYAGGLNNCKLTVLPLPSQDVYGGIALDKNGNLLVTNNSEVEVVDAPSYGTVNATSGTGFSCAENVRLNKANTLAFVTDYCNNTVTVVNYPSGTNAAVLGSGNGLAYPAAAVESPNAVY
jgi:hypothetical protein